MTNDETDPILSRLSATGGSYVQVKIACPCIDKSDVPMTDFGKLSRNFIAHIQDDPLLTYGLKTADAYETILGLCIERGMTHVLVVESDIIAPTNALSSLLVRSVTEGHAFVCGSYPFKDGSGLSVAITHDEAGDALRVPHPYEKRGLVPVKRALPMGCCVIDLRVVKTIEKPWFQTTKMRSATSGTLEDVSQDTYFTNKLLQAGYTPMLDTDIQCVHVCRETMACFGSPEFLVNGRLRLDAVKHLAVRESPWLYGYQFSGSQVAYSGFSASGTPGYFVIHGRSRDTGEAVEIEVSGYDLREILKGFSGLDLKILPP